jgi:hypothetical protein
VGTSRRTLGPEVISLAQEIALTRSGNTMVFLLWILAVILVVWGIVSLVRGQTLMGIVLIIVGLLVGPGGVSIFTK